MPLILIVGMPCTGKSTRAKQIMAGLTENFQKSVHIVSENEVLKTKNLNINYFYSNSQKEKEIRGILKSEALRKLSRDNTVILDASNYIKGYRYEIYCAVKNSKTTQLTIECVCNKEQAWTWNEARNEDCTYTRDIFDALELRYEAPDSRNRWDSPIIALQPHETLPIEDIYNALYLSKPPPPNQSTQCPPLSSSDFLHSLDLVTQDVVKELLNAKTLGCDEVKIGDVFVNCVSVNPPSLNKLRRQFINYTKLHPPSAPEAPTKDNLSNLFVLFLSSNLNSPS